MFSEKRTEDLNIDYDAELSDITDSNQSVKRRVRKTVDHQKVSLNLVCEWSECDYVCANKRLAFAEHVTSHVEDVAIVERPDKTGTHCSL